MDEDRIGDASLDRQLGLIALEHDARKRLQDGDVRARGHPQRMEPFGAAIGRCEDLDDDASRALARAA
jgi:hypothetical protein